MTRRIKSLCLKILNFSSPRQKSLLSAHSTSSTKLCSDATVKKFTQEIFIQ